MDLYRKKKMFLFDYYQEDISKSVQKPKNPIVLKVFNYNIYAKIRYLTINESMYQFGVKMCGVV